MTFPDYPFSPRRFEVRPGISMNYVDEGPRDGEGPRGDRTPRDVRGKSQGRSGPERGRGGDRDMVTRRFMVMRRMQAMRGGEMPFAGRGTRAPRLQGVRSKMLQGRGDRRPLRDA